MSKLQEKLLGGLLGGAFGDALGAITETYTTQMIVDYFGGYVTDFVAPPPNGLSRGTQAGMVTDDFSIAYYTAEDMLAACSEITEDIAKKALIRWGEHPEYTRYIGPTTRAALARISGKEPVKPILELTTWVKCNNFSPTNGGGMKAGIMGLFNPGNVEKAIDDAITMCMPTHNNTQALSGACAIAAAAAEAMKERTSWRSVIQAGIYGAEQGFKRALPIARPVGTPSVLKRTQLAVEIGLRHRGDFATAMGEISEIIGGSLYADEAIPAVFGHIAACEGQALESIYMGVNAGDDTDTVACMTGFIVGALHGVNAFPLKHLRRIDSLNHLDLGAMADEMEAYIIARERR